MNLHPEALTEEVEIECQTPDCGAVWFVPEDEFDPDNPEWLWCEECRSDSGEVAR